MEHIMQIKINCSASVFLLLSTISALQVMVEAIKIDKIVVPAVAFAGQGTNLSCHWILEGDTVYSVKWYQGANEFYRYTPSDTVQIQTFNSTVLTVDNQTSDGGKVVIANVSLNASGPFHCEVSADAPSFHTASHYANLTVIDIPDRPPEISGIRTQYEPLDQVSILCSTVRSRPEPNLTFTINNEPARKHWLYPQMNQLFDGLYDSKVRLRLKLDRSILRERGYATVKCTAKINNNSWESREYYLSTLSPSQRASVHGTASSEGRQHLYRIALFIVLQVFAVICL